MKRFKSILCISLLTLSLSSVAMAGDLTGRSTDSNRGGDLTGKPGDLTGKPGDLTGKPGDLTGRAGDLTGGAIEIILGLMGMLP